MRFSPLSNEEVAASVRSDQVVKVSDFVRMDKTWPFTQHHNLVWCFREINIQKNYVNTSGEIE